MRILALAAVLSFGSAARADQVTFPLVVDYPVLAAALTQTLHPEPGGTAVLWGTRDGCRSATVRDLRLERADGRIRITGSGRARIGFGFLGLCIAPVSWSGRLETVASAAIGRDWQLRFGDLDSHIYDADGKPTVVASRLWEVVKPGFEERVTRFAFDLGPPVDEAKALIRASAEPERARPVLAALDTVRPLSVIVDDGGIRVPVALDLPSGEAGGGPEPALAPVELAQWQAALERWDAFLVFVIKDLGALDADRAVRDELLAILLDSRQQLLAALAGGPEAGVDPVRQIFLDAWERLRQVVRDAAAHGVLGDRALRYVAFVTAGDALAALDAAGPSLGLEISADGLRRLARLLQPDYAGDPVAYSQSTDQSLRDLFGFHEPAVSSPADAAEGEPEGSSWLGPRPAWAATTPVADVDPLLRRLDRWVPRPEELDGYRDAVGRVLTIVAERTAEVNHVDPRFADLYRHVVATTAWQESCWRQFVERDGKVTYLLSSTGDIGLMQVNRRVWRGFFDVAKLEWDIGYNASAGAEILAQLLGRYGIREANERPENAARATYAAYNGGPDAYRRYRRGKIPRAQRAVDRAFWEKYQAMAAGQALDFVLCIESWRGPSRARLSTGPLASMSKCCMSSRRSRATPTMPSRHACIASRPRASFV